MSNIRILPQNLTGDLFAQKGFKPDILRTTQAGQILREGFGPWSPFFAFTPPKQLAQWDVEHPFGEHQVTVVALDGHNIVGRATIAGYDHPTILQNIPNSKGAYGLLDAVHPRYRKYGIWTAMTDTKLKIMEAAYPGQNLIFYSDFEHKYLREALFNIAARRGWEAHPALAPLYVQNAYNFESQIIEFNPDNQHWASLVIQQEHRQGNEKNQMIAYWNGLIYTQPTKNKSKLEEQQLMFDSLSTLEKTSYIATQIEQYARAGIFDGQTWVPTSGVKLLQRRQVHRAGVMRRA